MKVQEHMILTGITGTIIGYLLKINPKYIALFFVSGVFIDIDHVFDFLRITIKKKPLSSLIKRPIKTIKSMFNEKWWKEEKVWILFHSGELQILLLFLGLKFNTQWLTWLMLGAIFHQILDIIFNRILKKNYNLCIYSLICKILR